MFGKRKTSLLLPTNERFDTLIGKSSEIYGRMVVGDSLRVDGKVVGNIFTGLSAVKVHSVAAANCRLKDCGCNASPLSSGANCRMMTVVSANKEIPGCKVLPATAV